MDSGKGDRVPAPDPRPPDRLEACPYFREIFESMQCEKSSFRILRRPPFTRYTLHRDTDIGEATRRLQIPIRSGPGARF